VRNSKARKNDLVAWGKYASHTGLLLSEPVPNYYGPDSGYFTVEIAWTDIAKIITDFSYYEDEIEILYRRNPTKVDSV